MFLDIGLGIIAAIITSHTFSVPLSIGLIVFGIIFALSPDLDVIYLFFHPKAYYYKHRLWLHYPLLFLPIIGAVIYLIASKAYLFMFLIAALGHFIHDSIAYGRGIKWLYPFSSNGYAFFYLYSRTVKQGIWRWVFVFDQKYLEYFDNEHGDRDWMKQVYLKWHPIAIVELTFFILSLVLLIIFIN